MSPDPIPMLLDDDDIARMKRDNAVLVDRTALSVLLDWAEKQFMGPVDAAYRELRRSLEPPPAPVAVIQKRRAKR